MCTLYRKLYCYVHTLPITYYVHILPNTTLLCAHRLYYTVKCKHYRLLYHYVHILHAITVLTWTCYYRLPLHMQHDIKVLEMRTVEGLFRSSKFCDCDNYTGFPPHYPRLWCPVAPRWVRVQGISRATDGRGPSCRLEALIINSTGLVHAKCFIWCNFFMTFF